MKHDFNWIEACFGNTAMRFSLKNRSSHFSTELRFLVQNGLDEPCRGMNIISTGMRQRERLTQKQCRQMLVFFHQQNYDNTATITAKTQKRMIFLWSILWLKFWKGMTPSKRGLSCWWLQNYKQMFWYT